MINNININSNYNNYTSNKKEDVNKKELNEKNEIKNDDISSMSKVDRIKEEIKNGQYKINLDMTANKIAEFLI